MISTPLSDGTGSGRSRLRVLDLYAGLKGWSQPFADRGHETYSVELDPSFAPDLVADIGTLTAADLGGPGAFDIVLASPPCTHFTVMQIGRHWNKDHTPKTEQAQRSLDLVLHTVRLIRDLDPQAWVMENPVAKLRRLLEQHHPELERRTVHYCQYGEKRMKPTDLWSDRWLPSLDLLPVCRTRKNKDSELAGQAHVAADGSEWVLDADGKPCHARAARGSTTGTQGMSSAEAALIPYPLALQVCEAAERDLVVDPRRRSPTVFSDAVLAKAYGYVAGHVYARDEQVWIVRGSKRYVVRTDADPVKRTVTWASCTCPHGTQAPVGFPRCSHVAAVLIVVKEGIGVPADPALDSEPDHACAALWTTSRGEEDVCERDADHSGPHRGRQAEWWPS